MRVIDASSIVHGWDNYPIEQFPSFWSWIEQEVSADELQIPRVAYDEVVNTSPDCAKWLRDVGVQKLPVTNAILVRANAMKAMIGVVGDDFHPKGVGENDLIIVATAAEFEVELISDEGRQKVPPKEPRRMKIPAVCNLSGVSVVCINFVDYIKQSNAIFG